MQLLGNTRHQLREGYGIPLVWIGDRGENLQDDGIYFRVGYCF
ncbi:MAG: hypothetical protein WBA10_11725 [Elainellaceae cyanobacterium]